MTPTTTSIRRSVVLALALLLASPMLPALQTRAASPAPEQGAGAIAFATYFGGSGADDARISLADAQGNLVVVGSTASPDLPVKGAFQPTLSGPLDAFVAKFAPSGELVFSTYLGGELEDRIDHALVDADGNLVVVGFTASERFPLVAALQSKVHQHNGTTFVAKFDPAGTLLYSTYLGGSDQDIYALTIDPDGNLLIAGNTGDERFPVRRTLQPYKGIGDGFLTKLDPAGRIVFSTFVGGGGSDSISSMQFDAAGNIYLFGHTFSTTTFPVTRRIGVKHKQMSSFYAMRFSPIGKLGYSLRFGGAIHDTGSARVDAAGNLTIVGRTTSPIVPMVNAFQPTFGGSADLYLMRVDAGGTLVASSYLGGRDQEEYPLFHVRPETGEIVVVGQTNSTDFPLVGSLQRFLGGSFDLFVAKIDANNRLTYSTYIGGGRLETVTRTYFAPEGDVYLFGSTESGDFPLRNAFDSTYGIFAKYALRLDPAGVLVYSTFLCRGVTALPFVEFQSDGSLNVVGSTIGDGYPVRNAFQTAPAGDRDLVLTRLDRNGNAVYSTYLGGSGDDSERYGMSVVPVSGGGIVLVGTTQSSDYPTRDASQGTSGGGRDAFVTAVDGSGAVALSTYFGGSGEELYVETATATDAGIFFVGQTASLDLPVRSAAQPAFGGDRDLFVARLAAGVGNSPGLRP